MDKKILEYLAYDARITTTELAKKLKADRHVIEYRRKKLEREGYIISYHLNLNLDSLGLNEYVCYLKINKYYSHIKQIKEKLLSIPSLFWAAEILSEYNLRCTFLTKSIEEFEKDFIKLEDLLGHDLLEKRILQSKLLVKPTRFSTIHKKPTIKSDYIPDKDDMKIMKYLVGNPTASLVKIAKHTKTNVEFVRARFDNLKKTQIINQVEAKINVDKIGLTFKVNLLLNFSNFHKYKDAINKLAYSNVRFGRIRKYFGPWNLEIPLLAKSHKEVATTIKMLEERFEGDLRIFGFFIYGGSFIFKVPTEIIFDKDYKRVSKPKRK